MANLVFAAAVRLKQLVTPAAPKAGENTLYFKADNQLYSQNSSGTEVLIGPAPYVRLASTTNVSTSLTATIDSFSVVTGDRVLLKNQTGQAQNGVWVVNTAGSWTRAADLDTSAKIAGVNVRVLQGTLNGGQTYTNIFKSTDTFGTSNMLWFPLNQQTTYTPILGAATTAPTLGTGSVLRGDYILVGGFCTFSFYVNMGSGGSFNAGSGQYTISLPVPSIQFGSVFGEYKPAGTGNLTPWASELTPAGGAVVMKKWNTTAGSANQNIGNVDGVASTYFTCCGTYSYANALSAPP